MIDEIRQLLDTQPFLPFTINVADGREFSVPMPDHAHINPGGKRVTIFMDKSFQDILPGIMITGVMVEESHPEPSV